MVLILAMLPSLSYNCTSYLLVMSDMLVAVRPPVAQLTHHITQSIPTPVHCYGFVLHETSL